MPKIEQRYLDCSIYLYASELAADAGEKFGGSGCLVSVRSQPIYDPESWDDERQMFTKIDVYFPPHVYAVTNRHVVDPPHGTSYPVVRVNTSEGKHKSLPLTKQDWIPHKGGDDLAVAAIELPRETHDYSPISNLLFVTRHSLPLYLGAGDDTFMVGRFINHDGRQRNTPSLRFGSIAMLPGEEIQLGKKARGHLQKAFLVETRSLGGFSGSPVFIYKPSDWEVPVPKGSALSYAAVVWQPVGHVLLLGIDCGHAQTYNKVLDGSLNPIQQGWKVESNSGMSIVIPAWRLQDLLDQPELTMKRKQKDEEYQREMEAEKTVALDKEEPEPFTGRSDKDA